jgi:phage portal protein BeeE
MARGPRRGRNRIIQEVSIRPGLVQDGRRIPAFEAAFGGKSAIRSDRTTKSRFIDEFDLFHVYSGVREKHTRITFDLLRRMAATCEPVAAIIKLRCNQASAFAKLPRNRSDTGFQITTRRPEDKLGQAELKEAQRIQDFLLNTGLDPNPQRIDNFDRFLRKIVRDSLVLDAYAIETVPGRNPRKHPVTEIWAVDGATIRLAEEETYRPLVYTEEAGEIAYIQQIDGKVVAEYTQDELLYGVRNPSTDLDKNGYGTSELEEGINLITSILLASQFNRSYFSNNSTPRGFLELKGNYSEEHLDAFKRAWRQQLEGAANSWRTPIMAFDDDGELRWVPLDDKSHRDMEYHLWLDWLTNVLCSLYGVNPAELGMKGYQPSGPSLSDGSQKEQIDQGEDKGLVPLMTNIGNTLNSGVIWRINPEFSITWTGLDADDRDEEQQWYLGWQAAGILTTNEVRTQALDLPEIKEDWADAPANATLAGIYSQGKMAEQQAQMPGAATAGGPMQPPNANLQPHGAPPQGDKPGEGGAAPPKVGQPNPPAAPGQPQKPAGPPAGSQAGPPAPKPFGKSLGSDEGTEILIPMDE